MELDAPRAQSEPQGLRSTVGEAGEHGRPGRRREDRVVVEVHGGQAVAPAEERVRGTLRAECDRDDPDGASGGVGPCRPAEPDGHELVAEADAQHRQAATHGVAGELLGRGEPRVLGVVGRAHRAAEDDQPVGAGVLEPCRNRFTEVAADHVEVDPRRFPPLAEPRDRGVRLVLDDEESSRHHPTWVPTSAPMP